MGKQPVTSGTVSIVSIAGGTPVSASINPDGTYRVESVPSGDCLVSIVNQPDPDVVGELAISQKRLGQQIEKGNAELPANQPLAPKKLSIPTWYGDPITSGLSVKVQEIGHGETTFDIQISNKKPETAAP